MLCGGCYVLLTIWCQLFVVRCLLCVGRSSVFVVRSLMVTVCVFGCWMVFVVCCLLRVIYSLLVGI